MIPIGVSEIVEWTNGKLVEGCADVVVSSVTTDSRQASEGSLFVALRGERFDGHDFVNDALRRGAKGAVIHGEHSKVDVSRAEAVLIRVEDTLRALGRIGAGYLRRFHPDVNVIAVTGSSGKTTTKEMIGAILREQAPVVVAPASYNNEVGVPLTLLQVEPQHRAVVLEVAMRNLGDIAYLCEIAPPTVGVITNIGKAHIGRLGSQQAIAGAKSELLDALNSNGVAVLNADDAFFDLLKSRVDARRIKTVLTFGIRCPATFRAERILRPSSGATEFLLNGTLRVEIPVPGEHNVYNALAALAASSVLVSIEEAVKALRSFTPPKMRMEFRRSPHGFTVINDAYNANPNSMLAALEVLRNTEALGRKIAVLGEMLELGDFTEEESRKVGAACALSGVDVLITVGEGGHWIAEGARGADLPREKIKIVVMETEDVMSALIAVRSLVCAGDIVLVKASRAVGLERVAEGLLED